MKTLSKRQILLLHRQLIEQTGGSDGIRDEGLLDSAMAAPFQSFDNADAYPSLQQKAARLCFGLVKNHPFIDGNKRIGAHAMLVFLAVNGVELTYTQTQLSDIILQVAADEKDYPDLLDWLFVIRIEISVPLGSSPQMERSKMRKATLMGLFFCVSLGYALTGRLTGTAGQQ